MKKEKRVKQLREAIRELNLLMTTVEEFRENKAFQEERDAMIKKLKEIE